MGTNIGSSNSCKTLLRRYHQWAEFLLPRHLTFGDTPTIPVIDWQDQFVTHPVVSATSKDQLVISESAGGVVAQMAGVQERLHLPAGAGVAPVGVTAT